MKSRLLLIEDDLNSATMLAARLRHEGYGVEVSGTGSDGLARAIEGDADIVILDVMLPDRNGFEVCAALRNRGVRKPVLMLTARGEVEDRVTGLRIGADDYLTKPFEVVELVARLEALERRLRQDAIASSYRFGSVSVDLVAKTVTRAGAPVHFSGREFALLEFLVTHPDVVWSRDELLKRVWGYHRLPYTRTVDLHVAQLRQKLEDDPKEARYIVTVHGEGYRFVRPDRTDEPLDVELHRAEMSNRPKAQ
jgi:two-component system alkaline phosphatase synthesis response regulator PhoP